MFKKLVFILLSTILLSCREKPLPKPMGELRLEYPAPKYKAFDPPCAFGFEISDQVQVSQGKKACWYYLSYPKMKAKVFLTYYPVQGNFSTHVKEAEKLVYEHTIKASAIDTKTFKYPEKRVFGNFYELKGESASNVQFFVTDSTRYFVTANLYFNVRPKPDSLAPAIDYIKNDMLHMIDTFHWK